MPGSASAQGVPAGASFSIAVDGEQWGMIALELRLRAKNSRISPRTYLRQIAWRTRSTGTSAAAELNTIDMIHPDVIGRAAEIQLEFQRAKPFRHVARRLTYLLRRAKAR
jgi:hypothetical protein